MADRFDPSTNLGWKPPSERSSFENNGHADFLSRAPKFSIQQKTLAKGEGIFLYKTWKHPLVVADTKVEFKRFKQFSGSCIGVSLGNVLWTLGGIQRLLPSKATKAFFVFWPYTYGRTRFNEGDRGRGEGAINSFAIKTAKTDGLLDYHATPGLPRFEGLGSDDGITLAGGRREELDWSDGGSHLVTQHLEVGRKRFVGSGVAVNDVESIVSGLLNGYPYYFGCTRYCGSARLKGSGNTAIVVGTFDSNGGHSQCVTAAYNHPDFGLHLLVQNTWPQDVYERGVNFEEPPCSHWCHGDEFAKTWTRFQGRDEGFLVSHIEGLEEQPEVPTILSNYI